MPAANPQPEPQPVPSRRTPAKILGALALSGLSVLYHINPTAGFLEFIPDNIPIYGNLDEVAATALLLNCLAYLGLDLGNILARGKQRNEKNVTPPGQMPR